jgi:AraC-like DNA-binding protein
MLSTMSLPRHDPLPELRARVLRNASSSGRMQPIPRVAFWASSSIMPPRLALWEPVLYLVLQGTKRLTSGERVFEYGVGSFLLGTLHVPVLCEVVEASAAEPYLGVALGLDASLVSALLLEMTSKADPGRAMESDDGHALTIGQATVAMYDALLRLVRLLDAPADIPVLAPMIERELLYRVLQTPHGTMLRQLAQTGSRLSQVRRAVMWIREHLTERLRSETLAAVASMSVSTFFRHFKAVTGLSPLAYQKQIRLQEARRRLLVEPGAVAGVAFSVGYESASQFSREYARQFGRSPTRDAARLRAG